MKKLCVIAICSIFLLATAGCLGSMLPLGEESPIVQDTSPDIALEVVEGSVTPTKLTLSLKNNTATALTSGNLHDFHIALFYGGKWYIIETGVRTNTMELMLFSGHQTFDIHWSKIYGSLPSGHYRFVKHFIPLTQDGATGSGEGFYLIAEFDIP